MNILSLFDGISCGRVALERAGIPVTNYYAAEIDKYAIQVAQKNYPDTVQLGSVVGLMPPGNIDILMGGSPCQGFSFAGKQLAFDDPRSKLFFEWVRIWQKCKPTWWLLENVKMKKEHEQVINNILGCKPLRINSALVSAQNRERLYWTNIPVNAMPEDKGILLKDILEDGAVGCIKWQNKKDGAVYTESKGAALRASGGTDIRKRMQVVIDHNFTPASHETAPAYGAAQRGRNIVDGKRKDYLGAPTVQRIETNYIEKSNCLTSVQKDTLVLQRGSIRKLTPMECERLQTLPDNYTAGISNTQRYKCLGNGWTVDVIKHIFSFIPLYTYLPPQPSV